MKAKQRAIRPARPRDIKLCRETAGEPFRARQRRLPFGLGLAHAAPAPAQVIRIPIAPGAAPRSLRIELWPPGSGGIPLEGPNPAGYELRVFLGPG